MDASRKGTCYNVPVVSILAYLNPVVIVYVDDDVSKQEVALLCVMS